MPKQYTRGGRPHPQGGYVKRVIMLPARHAEDLDLIAQGEAISWAQLMRRIVRDYLRGRQQ